MNYWPAESTNLVGAGRAADRDWCWTSTETGARTAQVMYGARGWVAHHNTDLWRATAPVDGPRSGMWPTGGAWLCQHLWEHYEYTQDRAYLARDLSGAEGRLGVLPRHAGRGADAPLAGHLPVALAREPPPLRHQRSPPGRRWTRRSCAISSPTRSPRRRSSASIADARAAAPRRARGSPPHQIGKDGQLQEWLEDWDAAAPDLHHRHVSHLYALFPSDQITCAARRRSPPRRAGRSRFAVTRRPAGASAGG